MGGSRRLGENGTHLGDRLADAGLDPGDPGAHRGLELLRLVTHLLLQLLQLLELHLALDVGLHVGDVALHAPEQMPGGARDLGQALGPDHDQHHHADHHEFRKAEIEHVCSLETGAAAGPP